ncbi:uncharacterized protein MICPUCDRAFT_68471 [Micromonas pusilla CCMP1545]|uniref:Predicted protein n=1 Tax=Micromonas pusilla (strain CCMP1545) TaxID=564608 RepID=C1N2Y0_MICPC|nr:uncharacterized protein MICPUCDRAFT_68471 [Micromonas pusilla CCMP1545]EEH53330.1 predicted protein [Micromonas pusilla CCMP1545]|eukprot:XP_003062511.1 predicted protein [Micromonas pusilla CCMP1545]
MKLFGCRRDATPNIKPDRPFPSTARQRAPRRRRALAIGRALGVRVAMERPKPARERTREKKSPAAASASSGGTTTATATATATGDAEATATATREADAPSSSSAPRAEKKRRRERGRRGFFGDALHGALAASLAPVTGALEVTAHAARAMRRAGRSRAMRAAREWWKRAQGAIERVTSWRVSVGAADDNVRRAVD